VKIGKSARETLALLTVAYGENATKKSSVFEWHRRLKEGREDVQDDPRNWQAKNAKDRCKCGHSTNLGALRSKIRCEIIAEELNMNVNSATDYYGGFGNEKYFRKES
jgi:hypothetical protein